MSAPKRLLFGCIRASAGSWEMHTPHEQRPWGGRHGKVWWWWWCIAGLIANHPATCSLESMVKGPNAGPEEKRAGWGRKEEKEPLCLGKKKSWMRSKHAHPAASSSSGCASGNSFLHTPRAVLELPPFPVPNQVMVSINPDGSPRSFPNFPLGVTCGTVLLPAPLQKTPLGWLV